MPDETPATPPAETPADTKPASGRRARRTTAPAPAPADASSAARDADATPPPKRRAKTPEKPAPKRAELSPEERTLLTARLRLDRRRPVFGRQAANRYYRIGRFGAWRRPRGLQSKQRRHYGYRPKIVRIGYGSPAGVRGRVPSGFDPVIVHTDSEIEAIDPKRQAAIIARTVGTRRRLGLEDVARKRGVHVLNPLETPGEE